MIATFENLRAGMDDWVSRPGWPGDFHAPLYSSLQQLHVGGLTEEWWSSIVDHLAAWRALRPRTKAEITRSGEPKLATLGAEVATISAELNGRKASIEFLEWRTVERLYRVAHSIKDSSTPVFGSKLCHFILPNVFPVIDWDFTGVLTSSYREYWQMCHAEWSSCPNRAVLLGELSARIPSAHSHNFPWETKIIELCVAGSRRRAGARNSAIAQRSSRRQHLSSEAMTLTPIRKALERAGRELQSRDPNDPIAHADLVKLVAHYAGCSPTSVLPADFAYDRVNKGAVSRANPMFVQAGRGQWRFLGLDHPYTGPIVWKPVGEKERQVGHSTDGVVVFSHDPRRET